VVTRPGKRDSIVITGAGVVAMFTTNASPNDDFPPVEKKRYGSSRSSNATSARKDVQRSVDVYFNGFEAQKPEEMQSERQLHLSRNV